MSDDFFTPPPSGQQPPQPPEGPTPPAGLTPGMPGYSWHQHEQVRAQVFADAPSPVPMSGATVVAAVAGLGSLLMLVGAWAPWVTVSAFNETERVGGLQRGLDGKYVLALGIAALLAAATALTSQRNLQIRHISAGALVGLGLIGLGLVVHDWTTVTHRFDQANELINSLGGQLSGSAPGSNPFAAIGFDGFHVAKGWGLTVSGVASALTAIAGGYLFVVK